MVTPTYFINTLSEGTDGFGTIRYFARELQKAGIWPKGSLGGGKNAAQLSLANGIDFVLAYASAINAKKATTLLPIYHKLRQYGLKYGFTTSLFDGLLEICEDWGNPESEWSRTVSNFSLRAEHGGHFPLVMIEMMVSYERQGRIYRLEDEETQKIIDDLNEKNSP